MEAINNNPNVQSTTVKPKKIRKAIRDNIAVTAAAEAAVTAITIPFGIATKAGMKKINKSLSEEGKKEIKNCFDKILKTTNLKDKVYLQDFSGKEATNQTLLKRIKDCLFDETAAFVNGSNARYGRGVVECNMKKLPAAIFHELGHAYNDMNSPFWLKMQKIGKPALTITTLLILFCSLTKKAKPNEEGKKESAGQKFKNFIRNNAGKLAFMSAIPLLTEEGMATIRGNAWAKKLLDPSIAKKVYAHSAVAYISYLALATGAALATCTARKAKDNIDKKDEAQLQ